MTESLPNSEAEHQQQIRNIQGKMVMSTMQNKCKVEIIEEKKKKPKPAAEKIKQNQKSIPHKNQTHRIIKPIGIEKSTGDSQV